MALREVQDEMEKIADSPYIYDRVVTGAPRFIFGSQGERDVALEYTPTEKKICAVSLKKSCLSSNEDQVKFEKALCEQMSLLRRECSPNFHGGEKFHLHVQFGSMKIMCNKNGKAAGNVDDVEKMIQENAQPQNREEFMKAFHESKTGFWHTFKWQPLSSDRWESALDELNCKYASTREMYILQAEEEGKYFRLFFDSQRKFEKLDFPQVHWIQVDVKSPDEIKSMANFRIIVSTPRELDREDTKKVVDFPPYAKYTKEGALRDTQSGDVEPDASLISGVQSLRHETIQVYRFEGSSKNVELHAREAKTIEYSDGKSRLDEPNRKSNSFVRLFCELNNLEDVRTVATEMWAAAKVLLQHVDLSDEAAHSKLNTESRKEKRGKSGTQSKSTSSE